MIVKNPYSTSYGEMINIDNVIKEVTRYMDINKYPDLSYEVLDKPSAKIVFITGYKKQERELPIWDFPLYHNGVIYVDLRKYTKAPEVRDNLAEVEKPDRVESMFRDQASCRFLVAAAITMSQLNSEELTPLRPVLPCIGTAYGMLMSYCSDIIVKLNPIEMLDVEIAGYFFASIMLLYRDTYREFAPSIAARISNSRLSMQPNIKTVDKVINNMIEFGIQNNIGSFAKSLSVILPPEKAELITEGSIFQVLSNVWFGPGGTPTIIMSLECMGLFIPLLYTCMTDKTYKKTKLSTIFDKYKKNINDQLVVTTIGNFFNANAVSIDYK